MGPRDGAGWIWYLAIIGVLITALPTFIAVAWVIAFMIPGDRADRFIEQKLLPWSIKLLLWWRRLKCLLFFMWGKK